MGNCNDGVFCLLLQLRTFVALDVVNDMDPDDVVFGGGGCVDVEVRCIVQDLVRLCEPCEVMDVKRDDDVRGDESAGAEGSQRRGSQRVRAARQGRVDD